MRASGWFSSLAVGLGTLLLAGQLLGEKTVEAQSPLPIFNGGGFFNVDVTSYKAQRYTRVVRQKYDFSCGSAAVATLLTYHYDQPTTEKVVFKDMYERGDQEKIHSEGFSLLDMMNYLGRRGYRANGFRVPLDKLVEADVPAIVLTNTRGYKHFVVVKGVTEDKVLVADPALGNRIVPREEFEAVWNGIAFVILDDSEMAQAFVNAEKDWQIRQKAPIGEGRGAEDIGFFALNLPGANFF